VLIVDDEKSIVKMLSRMFESFSLRVYSSMSGEEAINLAIANQPDLICLDIMMPGLSGFQTAEILRANQATKSIPIVIITAKNDREYMVYSRQIGILDYLTKPISRQDIELRLDYWLQHRQQ